MPFAQLLLSSLPNRRFTPEQDAAEQLRQKEALARVSAAAEAFHKSPTAETMVDLERAVFGNVAHRDMPETFTRLGLQASAFLPFLGVPAEGRGLKRCDTGAAAAEMLMQLVAHGVAPREATLGALEATLTGDSKDARRNAACVLAYCDLKQGSTTVQARRAHAVLRMSTTATLSSVEPAGLVTFTVKVRASKLLPPGRGML